MEINKDLYFVAVKLFLEDDSGAFLITKDRFGDWDIPGGRLREMDFVTPLEDVIKRKIHEELGDNVKYELQKPIVFMRHERDEVISDTERAKRRIFAIGYQAKYLGGEIKLGQSHVEYKWVSVNNFKPSDCFTGGWLKGVEEYIRIRKQ